MTPIKAVCFFLIFVLGAFFFATGIYIGHICIKEKIPQGLPVIVIMLWFGCLLILSAFSNISTTLRRDRENRNFAWGIRRNDI